MKNINLAIFLIYAFVSITPSFVNLYFQIVLMFAWFFTAFMLGWRNELDFKTPIIVWFGYAVFLRLINYSTAAWGNYGMYFLFYFPLFVFDFYKKNLEKKEIAIVCKTIVAVLCVNIVQNIYVLLLYPGATIQLNFSNEYVGMNLGNGNFNFAVMLMLLACFGFALKKKKIYALMSALGFFYLILSSKTTALLIFVIFSMLFVADRLTNKLNVVQKIFYMIIITAIIPLLFFEILHLIQIISHNDYINTRIDAILIGDTGSKYLSRIGLAKISFDSFLSNPFFGIGFVKADFGKEVYYKLGIGHHSEFIDHLGRYGLVGLSFYILIFTKYWKNLKNLCKRIDNLNISSLVFLSFLVYSFLNNSMDYISGIILGFIIPAVCFGCFDECDENNNF